MDETEQGRRFRNRIYLLSICENLDEQQLKTLAGACLVRMTHAPRAVLEALSTPQRMHLYGMMHSDEDRTQVMEAVALQQNEDRRRQEEPRLA